jgi:hypothetical protein
MAGMLSVGKVSTAFFVILTIGRCRTGVTVLVWRSSLEQDLPRAGSFSWPARGCIIIIIISSSNNSKSSNTDDNGMGNKLSR